MQNTKAIEARATLSVLLKAIGPNKSRIQNPAEAALTEVVMQAMHQADSVIADYLAEEEKANLAASDNVETLIFFPEFGCAYHSWPDCFSARKPTEFNLKTFSKVKLIDSNPLQVGEIIGCQRHGNEMPSYFVKLESSSIWVRENKLQAI